MALQLDIGRPATFDGFAAEVGNALSTPGAERFDHPVNNAGTSSTATLANGTEDEPYAQLGRDAVRPASSSSRS